MPYLETCNGETPVFSTTWGSLGHLLKQYQFWISVTNPVIFAWFCLKYYRSRWFCWKKLIFIQIWGITKHAARGSETSTITETLSYLISPSNLMSFQANLKVYVPVEIYIYILCVHSFVKVTSLKSILKMLCQKSPSIYTSLPQSLMKMPNYESLWYKPYTNDIKCCKLIRGNIKCCTYHASFNNKVMTLQIVGQLAFFA